MAQGKPSHMQHAQSASNQVMGLQSVIYMVAGQPRGDEPPRLAQHGWLLSSKEEKCASTLIEESAYGKTVPASTYVHSVVAVVHTPCTAVHSGAHLPAKHSSTRTDTPPVTLPPYGAPIPPTFSDHHSLTQHSHTHNFSTHTIPRPHSPPFPSITFPINVSVLASFLQAHPHQERIQYLIQGFTHGFLTGYQGPWSPRTAHNLSSAKSRPAIISKYITSECQAGHTAGPFATPTSVHC